MSQKITVRLDDAEYSRIKELADLSGLPLSTFTKTRLVLGLDYAKFEEAQEAQMLVNHELMRRIVTTNIMLLSLLPPTEKSEEAKARINQIAKKATDDFFNF
jgi:hypothetical protein